jgi:hypothetical protein
MPQLSSIHFVYRPQPGVPTPVATGPAPVANQPAASPPAAATNLWGTVPGYPTVPTAPAPIYGTTPTYGTVPAYPGYPAPTNAGLGLLGSAASWLGGAIAGLKAGGSWRRATTAVRRSRAASYSTRAPRGYGSRYTTRSTGRARVGMTGKVGGQFMSAVKTSVIWGSLISIGVNTWGVMKNQQTFAQAGSNITGDVMSSVVGGVGGAAASALGTAIFGGMLGSGLMLSVASIGFGIAGFMIADGIFRNTNFFKTVTGKVQAMLT